MAHLGMSTALRSMATKGMAACTARNHCNRGEAGEGAAELG